MRSAFVRYLPIAALIAAVSVLHYATDPSAHRLHDIYRRLYYLPIILAAFAGGIRGGTLAAIAVCVVYWPHAFGHYTHDPGRPVEKVLEMVLYVVVGAVTGLLVSREAATKERLRKTADSLAASLREKERMEEELIRSAKLAAVGKLSAGLAHEIRNPLTSIKASAELLADDFPAGHPKRDLLDTLVKETVRLNGVLTRFLSFAKPRPMAKKELDPAEGISEVIALLRGRREEDGETPIRFHDPDGPLPRVKGDPEQIRQVLLNVLLNALQASGEGGRVDVFASHMKDPGRIEIVVEDDGPGFDADAIENLFTPFYTTKEGGTGLGLAISHRIVESHGGRIRVSNREEGGGARLVIELPAA
ncbi:MAG: ATP-binding protein [Candidatus Eisenbacteria bacterium]